MKRSEAIRLAKDEIANYYRQGDTAEAMFWEIILPILIKPYGHSTKRPRSKRRKI